MKFRLILILGAMLLVSLLGLAVDDWDAAGKTWWAHVQYLADDKLAGRHPGTPGFTLAAQYVEGQFKAAGLRSAGADGFLQPVKFDVLELDEASSRWKLEANGSETDVQLGDDAILSAHVEGGEPVEADAVFVGYGFAVPQRGFDEFKNIDLRGKIAVSIGGQPVSIPGPISTYYQSFSERWDALRKAGAIGLVNIANPKLSLPWERMVASRQPETLVLADPALNESPGLKFAATINPAHADKFLAGSGHTFAELLALADAGQPLPKFPLASKFVTHVAIKRLPQIAAPNIIGVLTGSDPQLKHEYLVLSAHLDHLGVGRPVNGDNIYNGAMDNASGIASLIEIARQLGTAANRPKRSILFAAWTGEESGMLGSQYFVAHLTVKRSDIVGVINMDMFLPLFALHYWKCKASASHPWAMTSARSRSLTTSKFSSISNHLKIASSAAIRPASQDKEFQAWRSSSVGFRVPRRKKPSMNGFIPGTTRPPTTPSSLSIWWPLPSSLISLRSWLCGWQTPSRDHRGIRRASTLGSQSPVHRNRTQRLLQRARWSDPAI